LPRLKSCIAKEKAAEVKNSSSLLETESGGERRKKQDGSIKHSKIGWSLHSHKPTSYQYHQEKGLTSLKPKFKELNLAPLRFNILPRIGI